MRLTNTKVKRTKPADKPFKLFDGEGLFLLVTPAGSKWWRMKYRFGGKEKQAALGVYPGVSLSDARSKLKSLRSLLADGIDPGEHVKMERASQRIAVDRQTAATRYTLDNDGALSFRLGNRRLVLSPDETSQLRIFLDATSSVNSKVTSCR